MLSGDPDTGTVTYTPDPGYLGPDSFIFNAQDLPDPGQPSNIATATITVAAPPDTAAPETTIAGKRKYKTRKRRVLATFSLGSEPEATFECSVDSRAFAPCTSPFTTKLRLGKHLLTVRSRDAGGNVDASPATLSLRVKRRRPQI